MLISYPISYFMLRERETVVEPTQSDRATTISTGLTPLPLGDGTCYVPDHAYDNRALGSGCRMIPYWVS